MRIAGLTLLARCLLAGRIAAASLAACSIAHAQTHRERVDAEVKASFLMNFARFVEWPPESPATLEVCALGDETLAAALERRLSGKPVQGRIVQVRRRLTDGDAASCHVLFISLWRRRIDQVIASLGGAPVLTLSDAPGFLVTGGMVAIMVDGERVRFEVNHQQALRGGLKISSQLLRLSANGR